MQGDRSWAGSRRRTGLIIAVVVLVLFGYKKLPEMSRSVGRSLRIFKTEMKGMSEDDSARDSSRAGSRGRRPRPRSRRCLPGARRSRRRRRDRSGTGTPAPRRRGATGAPQQQAQA